MQGNYLQAIKDFNSSLTFKDGKTYHVFFNRGMAFYSLKLYDEAIKDFTTAISLSPACSEAYFTRGVCNFYLKNFDDACKDLNKAKAINPDLKDSQTIANYCSGNSKGQFKQYYKNGNISVEGFYDAQIPYGKWKEYYENGKLMEEYFYEHGLKQGSDKYFHDNGNLWTERIYKEGKLWEVISNFDINGNPLDKGTITQGNGTVKVYDEKGNIIESINYVNGEKN